MVKPCVPLTPVSLISDLLHGLAYCSYGFPIYTESRNVKEYFGIGWGKTEVLWVLEDTQVCCVWVFGAASLPFQLLHPLTKKDSSMSSRNGDLTVEAEEKRAGQP